MTLSIPNIFVAGTKILAEHMNENFTAIKNYIEGSVANDLSNHNINENAHDYLARKNGDSNETFTVANATEDNHAVSKSQLTSAISNIRPDLTTPYAVNSGRKNVDGYAEFIEKTDDSSIKLLAGNTNPATIMTYSDGSIESIESDLTIGSISDDGTYIVIKEKGQNPVLTTNEITECFKAPSNPENGDLWLDIGVKPYKPYKYDGSAWQECQFVKLGEVTKTSGTLEVPVSYAFNRQLFVENIDIPSVGGYQSLALNTLGIKLNPDDVNLSLVCVTANNGYNVGDEIPFYGYAGAGYATVPAFVTDEAISIIYPYNQTYIYRKTDGVLITAVTESHWRIKININKQDLSI